MLTLPDVSLWDELAVSPLPLVLYGMGDGADKIRAVLAARSLSVSAVFASDDFFRPGKTYAGLPVERLSDIEARFADFIILVAFGSHLPELHARVEALAARHTVRIPDVPVAGVTLFDLPFAEAHFAELSRVYGLLADDASRAVFQAVVSYKITGRPEDLFSCETPEDEGWRLLELGGAEHYLDLGAYRGDTVAKFLSLTGDYASVTAAEPDPAAFRWLTQNCGTLPRSDLIHGAIGSCEGSVPFSRGRGRGSHAGAGELIPQYTVDDLAARLSHSFTFLKADVEGAEKETLLGAAAALKGHPKLNIALYHRSEDLYELPLLVHGADPSYQLFVRRHPCFPCWDLNLYAK